MTGIHVIFLHHIDINGLGMDINRAFMAEKSSWPQFYQTRSAWSVDQGSTKKRSAVHNFIPTVTKFCVMWEGLSLPQDTKFGNCRDEIVDIGVIFIWSLIHGSSWSGLIKVGPVRKLWGKLPVHILAIRVNPVARCIIFVELGYTLDACMICRSTLQE